MNWNKYPKIIIHDIGQCVRGWVYFWLSSNAFEAEINENKGLEMGNSCCKCHFIGNDLCRKSAFHHECFLGAGLKNSRFRCITIAEYGSIALNFDDLKYSLNNKK